MSSTPVTTSPASPEPSSLQTGGSSGFDDRPLTAYRVLKSKEGGIKYWGVRVDVLGILVIAAFLLAFLVKVWLGVTFGVLTITTLIGVFRGRPRGWLAYGFIYFRRRRSIFVPAAPSSSLWEVTLRVLDNRNTAR